MKSDDPFETSRLCRDFLPDEMAAFDNDAKVGLLATIDPAGRPHATLITTLQAKTPRVLTWGQFCEGRSKQHVHDNPRTGFLIMTPDRHIWRGQATWTGEVREGDDYEAYNRKPMFRYNSYFGIHTVHRMDLVRSSGRESLSIPGIAAGSLVAAAAGRLGRRAGGQPALKPWAEQHLRSLGTFKFLVWIRPDGYPNIVPLVPCHPAGAGTLTYARTVYRDELSQLPQGADVAVFAMNMDAVSVLVRGTFSGYHRRFGATLGTVEIDWVYNTMPPKPGQVFPVQPIEPVRSFEVAR